MAGTAIDETRLEAFLGQMVGDMGAAFSLLLTRIGEQTGLYTAMAGAGPLTAAEVAQRAACDERYVREWLSNQAAGGYVDYDRATDRFTLPDEHAMALADDSAVTYMCGGLDVLASVFADEARFVEAFRTGEGIGWHEHDHRLFSGTERFFRPGYQQHLVAEWIPALDGVEEKLRQGAKVADVGCGHGASVVLMAEAYPASRFVGVDYHEASIEQARARVEEAGVADRCEFVVGAAQDLAPAGYDLVCNFDCLHDMGDPVGAARAARAALAGDGTYMIVEPLAGDGLTENMHPVGRLFYGASTLICTAHAKSQAPGLALGAQAGEARLGEVLEEAGFSRIRRATDTPFNMVLEARP